MAALMGKRLYRSRTAVKGLKYKGQGKQRDIIGVCSANFSLTVIQIIKRMAPKIFLIDPCLR